MLNLPSIFFAILYTIQKDICYAKHSYTRRNINIILFSRSIVLTIFQCFVWTIFGKQTKIKDMIDFCELIYVHTKNRKMMQMLLTGSVKIRYSCSSKLACWQSGWCVGLQIRSSPVRFRGKPPKCKKWLFYKIFFETYKRTLRFFFHFLLVFNKGFYSKTHIFDTECIVSCQLL